MTVAGRTESAPRCRQADVVNEMCSGIDVLESEIRRCSICAPEFEATATAHSPRPVPWLSSAAPVLIAGQAPGAKVHESGRPFTDPSGDRLRRWLGVGGTAFYDRSRFAILPMAFCFPGYDARGSDLPPPPVCARTWRRRTLDSMPQIRLTILVGAAAMRWHLGSRFGSVTDAVRDWRRFAPEVFPLPHPSWRNNAWITRNPWFEREVLPELRRTVSRAIEFPEAPPEGGPGRKTV